MPDLTNLARLRDIMAAATPGRMRSTGVNNQRTMQIRSACCCAPIATFNSWDGNEVNHDRGKNNSQAFAAAANTLPALVAFENRIECENLHLIEPPEPCGKCPNCVAKATLDRELGAALGGE